MKDGCDFSRVEPFGDVASEVHDKVLPTYCPLVVIIGLVTQVSRRLLAALCPVRVVAKVESGPNSAFDVRATVSMILRC